MAVQGTPKSFVPYDGNDVTVEFPITFGYDQTSDVICYLDTTLQVEGAAEDYTISSQTLTMNTAPATGETLYIYRETEKTQGVDYREVGVDSKEVTESALDKITYILQEIGDKALIVTGRIGDADFDNTIPNPEASKYLRVNSDGDGFELVSLQSSGTIVVSAFMETILDDADASEARATLGLTTFSTFANETALLAGSGATDGEITVDLATGNICTWDAGNSKWRIRSGNIYASNPSASNYTIETGTVIFNTDLNATVKYNGTNWILEDLPPLGYAARGKWTWDSTTQITIGPSSYRHVGTADQRVFWSADLAITISGYTGTKFIYLYIDDSAIGATNELTANEIIPSETPPSWNDAKHDHYNGDDKCLGAVRLVSNVLQEFWDIGDALLYVNKIQEATGSTSTSWTEDQALTVPTFCGVAIVSAYVSSPNQLYARPGDSTDTTGIVIGGNTQNEMQTRISLDSSQQIDFKASAASGPYYIYTSGYVFPRSM